MRGRLHLYKMVLKGFLKSLTAEKNIDKRETPIDFVVTWVDGNDPEWNKQKLQYESKHSGNLTGNGSSRYRGWDSFIYWFRAVEKYAPWVRNVYLVTWGHVPAWLNVNCPNLKIVKHTDFIPEEFLPTFNCNTIELNLFRIPDLSENFVYFNDDMLLCRPVKKEEFFANDKPKHTAIAMPYINRDNEIPYHLFFNTYGIANKRNYVQSCIEKYPEKWFSHLYKSGIKHNVGAWQNEGLAGMFFSHMGTPFCKSTMQKTWEKHEKECIETCMYKFRDIHQITHQIYSIEDILCGHFVPSKADWGTCLSIEKVEDIAAAYKTQVGKMVCLFDSDNLTEVEIENINKELVLTFNKYLPEKSKFEL